MTEDGGQQQRADARGGDGGVREELANGAPMTFETVVAECPQSRTNGKHLLVLSITGFDPEPTFGVMRVFPLQFGLSLSP
jgi:hypothetical protein